MEPQALEEVLVLAEQDTRPPLDLIYGDEANMLAVEARNTGVVVLNF